MIDLPMDSDATHAVVPGWQADNERGLALAAEADWAEAAEAFAGAADALARALPANAMAHEPLALVLGNLAQAYFRAGRIDDALQQAQRTCALRVALAGEDGMPVARARMDLAVMLATAGRVDEAMALVQRAIATIEHRVGDEDARLAVVLENAARIALAAAAPANAEPLLLRLHALLDAHGLSTARAEQLLARIASVRARQADEAMARADRHAGEPPHPPASAGETLAPSTMTPVSAVLAEVQRTLAEQAFVEPAIDVQVEETRAAEPETRIAGRASPDDFAAYLDASLLPDEDWEDQPLRDAVAVTDVLLRSTPSGVPVIPDPLDVEPAVVGEPALVDAPPTELSLDLADDFGEPSTAADDALLLDIGTSVTEPTPGAAVAELTTSTPASDPDEIELDLTIDVPVESGLMLGFAVEHGVVDTSFDDDVIVPPPVSVPVPDPLTAPLLTQPVEYTAPPAQPFPEPAPAPAEPPSPIRRVDITHAAPVSAPPVAPIAGMVSTAPPVATASGPIARGPTGSPSTRPEGQQPAPMDRTEGATSRRSRSAPDTTAGGSSKLPFIIGGVVIVGGAAAWFLLR